MNILIEIQKRYNSFSDKEKFIADFILKQKETINNISITDLAKQTKTSASTITRFCKKTGCQSFVDMKIKINTLKSEVKQHEEESLFSDIYNYYNEVINRTKELIDKDAIYEFIGYLRSAKKIYILGVGSSGLSGSEMMQRLLRMGFNVQSISDSHMMIINSSIVSEDDLIIGISVSGQTKELVQSLKLCKKNGAKIVGITSFENSDITKYCDMKFIVYNTLFINKESFINSQFSTMYLLDLICTVLLKDEKLRNNLKVTIDAIINN